MGEENQQVLKQNVSVVLDEILARHMERLLGSRFGIDGLPMNLRTIACITLLTDGMGISENPPSDAEEAHTLESLKVELGDLGLDRDEELQPLLEDLTRRGYVLAEDNRLFPGKPAATMAQVLGRVFPKMSGAAFLAYLVQTIDEVSTGRKALEAAAVQFDQTLKMQGVPLKRRSEQPAQKKVDESHGPSRGAREDSPPRVLHGSPVPRTYGRREEGRVRVLGSSVDSLVFEVREAQTVGPPSPEPPPCHEIREETEVRESLEEQDIATGPSPVDDEPEQPSEPLNDAAPEPSGQTSEETGPEAPLSMAESSSDLLPAPDPEPPALVEEPPEPVPECTVVEEEEDSLEKKISGFEEELAAQCPLCSTSTVRSRKTPAGRTYYQCSNRQCSFVSWGRPHHVPCPRCKNAFMVEVPETEGRQLLRCPRATCRYTRALSSPARELPAEDLSSKQGPPLGGDRRVEAPRRRVVRRRVVRKKK